MPVLCWYCGAVLSVYIASVLRHYHGKFAVQILNNLTFKFIKFFCINNEHYFFQKLDKMKNNLIYTEMVKVLL
jgi:hypothetical protein